MGVEPCGLRGLGLHFAGQGHNTWGAIVGTVLVGITQPLDVSAYRGVSFLVRSRSATTMFVKIENPYSQPACGKCDDTVIGAECYSGYIRTVMLPADVIVPMTVMWSDFAQQTWGYRAPGTALFDAANLETFSFAFDKGVDFDVCFDDVTLVP
jgi:hypothetical protein